MNESVKRKVVTSGRLSGRVAGRPTRRRTTSHAGPPGCQGPAYSLYSTDSEDQVTTLHKGLDQCAALLSGILQAEKGGSPSHPRAVKGGAAKSRPTLTLGMKRGKKVTTLADQKSRLSNTPRSRRLSAAQAKLRLPPAPPVALLQPQVPPSHVSDTPHCPHTYTPPHTHAAADGDGDEEDEDEDEFVPVRDVAPWGSQPHIHPCPPVELHTQPHIHPCPPVELHTQPDAHSSCEAAGPEKRVQYLLGELKAVMAGQGSAAETLLRDVEKSLSSPQIDGGSLNLNSGAHLLSVSSPNTLPSRPVTLVQQPLKQREDPERQHNTEPLCSSEVLGLRAELRASQSRQQQLQEQCTELQRAVRDTQSQLRHSQTANEALQTDLKVIRSRFVDSEREKSELALLAQQRLEEIENLNRVLQSVAASGPPGPGRLPGQPAEGSTERVTRYLRSLGPQPRTLVPEQQATEQRSVSQCDREWLGCDWSVRSESTFNTRDELAFTEGLAALDASIASLQKTIQLDLCNK